MATLAEHPTVAPSSTSPMPNMNACYDPDIDSFLNLDQIAYTSTEPARPKAALASQPAMPSTEFVAPDMRSASFASNGQSPMAFQAPSHQYDEHKQQTGLPPGALAHAMTFNNNNNNNNSNNQVNGMGFSAPSPGFAINGDMYNQGQVKREDPLDFNAIPARNPSEMDLEGDNIGSVPGYFFSPNSNKSQFVDPNALGGQEVVPVGHSTQVGRMYPGMHQQAAMAKAQQQKQHEIIRHQQHQHQHQQQQQQQFQQQRRMEEQTPQEATPQPRAHRNPDPVVEERISRLLQQIRQNTNSPGDSPSPSLPQMARARKEEQDMDEDERLLASEEGKKLSSKERRQLRNKVSARAFRSRRKGMLQFFFLLRLVLNQLTVYAEYIGQLESEIASRTNETHDLRLQNRALYEENSRLTDLAHMLLSSPHFSNFMDEMNVNGMPQPQATQQQPQAQAQPQPQQQQPSQPSQPQQAMAQPSMQSNVPKESNPSATPQEFQMQQNSQAGMVMVPNQGMDMSTMSLNNGGWNSGIDMNFTNAAVFAVMELPEGPSLDTEAISGKSSSLLGNCLPQPSKDEVPAFECPPVAEESKESMGIENPDVEIDESDPAFALFLDSPPSSQETSEQFDGVKSEKASPIFELVVEGDSRTSADRIAQLCLSMEAAFQRVSTATSHLL